MSKALSDAKSLIPGGSQLFSKRPELHAPELWPSHGDKASGITVTDLDGNQYKDFYMMNVGANILGYRDEDVDQAVIQAISKGQSSSLNFPEEIELARLLITLHPWAQQCRFTRSGGEAVAVAVRIARAHTHRDKILVCGYHGWTDPYMASGVITNNGVPKQLSGTTVPFQYNCSEDHIEQLIHSTVPAAIVMEPMRYEEPRKGWLEYIRALADESGTVLIFDEISSGFRFNLGGVHLQLGIRPDIAVFSKAMGNGYPIAAIVGTKACMQAAENTFISSTTWSERIGFAAGLATIQKLWVQDVHEYVYGIGQKVDHYLSTHGVKVTGRPQMLHFDLGQNRTIFTQLMLEKGYLAGNQFYPSFAHSSEETFRFLKTAGEVLLNMPSEALRGPVAHEGFPRLT